MNSAHTMLPVVPLGVLASLSHPRFHLPFHLAHRLMDDVTERSHDGVIAAQGVKQTKPTSTPRM